MTEVVVFALVVGNYGLGLRRDGVPYVSLCGAATAVYWAVRVVCGFTFLAVARHVGRDPLFFGESAMMAVAPVAAACAYAAVRLLEARALRALAAREATPAPAADPASLLPEAHRSPHPRLSLREERVLAVALVVAGCVFFGHTLATARPFWREDLGADDRGLLRRRADEVARLEARLLDCGAPPLARDRETHRRALEDLSRRGLLRIGAHRASPDDVLRSLDAVRAERCGPRSSR
ncbi:MAG: hypothetical protein HY906_27395 [Deltaproteobacteria bacterium]|nr:hypothetical protein [Deltaproteobacteria bacterium]